MLKAASTCLSTDRHEPRPFKPTPEQRQAKRAEQALSALMEQHGLEPIFTYYAEPYCSALCRDREGKLSLVHGEAKAPAPVDLAASFRIHAGLRDCDYEDGEHVSWWMDKISQALSKSP